MSEKTIKGRHKIDIINDLANDMSVAEVADKYDISVPYVNRLRQQWSLEIEAKRLHPEDKQGALWITDPDKRLAEYEAIYEEHEGFVDPKSVRIRLDCLRAVSELMGQLPQRHQQAPNVQEITYRIAGAEPGDVV